MTDGELKRLAHYIVMEQATNHEWMTAFAKVQAETRQKEQKLIRAKDAADMLGISVWQLYRIKDSFSYTKTGSNGTLKFNSATLLQEYEKYLCQI